MKMNIKLTDIILLGIAAVGGYFAYKYITGINSVKEGVAAATSPIYNFFTGSPEQAGYQAAETLTNAAITTGENLTGGAGIITPTTENIIGEVPQADLVQDFVNAAIGILKVNPFTAPVSGLVGAAVGYTTDVIAGNIEKSAIRSIPPTEMATPTIEKSIVENQAEILGSAAPSIVKYKLLAGKI